MSNATANLTHKFTGSKSHWAQVARFAATPTDLYHIAQDRWDKAVRLRKERNRKREAKRYGHFLDSIELS